MAPVNRRAGSFLVMGAMALSALILAPRLNAPVAFDGKAAYLPMAREVLEHGWAYLSNPDSVHYAPLSFLWPALLGAREMLVREANIALYCVAIAFACVALRKAHSERAGVIAAVLLAICPTVRPYIADVLTESPFIFLTAAWALCVAQVEAGGKRGWIVAGGVALAAAALLRPAVMYFAPLALAYFAWKRRRPLAVLHAIATLGIALWVIRNAVVFGFPAISAGAGGALYFGVNPLVDGFDPPYYGMGFDSGLAQDSPSHLSIHSDRVLRGIATLELLDTPLSYLLPMFIHKALAFIFVTAMEPSGEPLAWMRAWRVAAVVLAAIGVATNRRSAFVAALAGFAVYMVAVHVPLLYTHRYSVGALDFPLAVLAGIGIAESMRGASRAAIALVGTGLALGVGLANATPGPGSPMPDRIPNEVVWLGREDGTRVVTRGTPIDVEVRRTGGTPEWDLSMLQFDLAVKPTRPGACSAVVLRFKPIRDAAFEPGRAVRVPLDLSPGTHRYTVGSTVPLAIDSGTVRFEFDCRDAAYVSLGTVAVIKPKRELYYRDLYRARMAGKGA